MNLAIDKTYLIVVFALGISWQWGFGQDIMLSTACIGEPYNEEVSLVLEESYSINGTVIYLDAASIQSIFGLPDGLDWYCSPCSGRPGQAIRVFITGTPTVDNDIGLINLDFTGVVTVNGAGFTVDFPYGGTVGDTYAMELEDCNEENCYIPIDADTESASCFDACDGSVTALPDRGVEPYSYVWDNGMTGQTITDLCSGIYFVTVTDATGCESTTSIVLSHLSDECEAACELELQFDVQDASCPEECDGSATVGVENGTPPYIYDWGPGTGRQDTPTAENLCPGTYDITVTDANFCEITASVTVSNVEENCAPPVCELSTAVVHNDVQCSNDCNARAEVIPSGGQPPYRFQWDAAAASQTSAVANNLCVGTYQVTTTDAIGCSQIDTVQIKATSDLTINALVSAYKPNECRRKGVVVVQGYKGQAPYSYRWSNGMTTNRLDSLPIGYPSITVTDAAGCSVSQVFPNEGRRKDNYCDLITFVRNNTVLTRYTFRVPETVNTGRWSIEGGIFPNVIELDEAPALTYTFAVEGTYTVCYTFQNNEGCEIQCCKDVRIERTIADCVLEQNLNAAQDVFEIIMPEVNEVAWLHGDNITLDPMLELPARPDCTPQQIYAVYLNQSGDYYRLCQSNISLCTGANRNGNPNVLQSGWTNSTFQLQNVPNPWQSETTIRFQSPRATTGQLEIRNMSGQRIFQRKLQLSKGSMEIPLHLSLPPGLYVYSLTTPDFSASAVMNVVR